jgi:serine/threonine protein kinase
LLYLHQHEPVVVHSDLKGVSLFHQPVSWNCALTLCISDLRVSQANILIDDNGTAVLADFGFSRIQYEISGSLSSSLTGGTGRYMSPEFLFDESNKPTWSSDIWALGMVIYEVFTGRDPFSEIVDQRAVVIAIREGRLPQSPKYMAACLGFTDDLWKFLEESSWANIAEERPKAEHCLKRLKELALRWAREKAAKAASPRVRGVCPWINQLLY